MIRHLTIHVSDSIGNVSAEMMQPEEMHALFVFAHGAGANMNHAFMVALSKELASINIGTLRFNFPFMENKKGRPDVPAVAHSTIEAVIQKAKQLYPSTPLYMGGKSFGGRMSSQLMATRPVTNIKGIIFLGFPLHPAGKPAVERAEHLKNISVPMLFLQGTRDALAEWALVNEVTGNLKLATLLKLEGADHSFKAGKQNLIPILATSIHRWIAR